MEVHEGNTSQGNPKLLDFHTGRTTPSSTSRRTRRQAGLGCAVFEGGGGAGGGIPRGRAGRPRAGLYADGFLSDEALEELYAAVPRRDGLVRREARLFGRVLRRRLQSQSAAPGRRGAKGGNHRPQMNRRPQPEDGLGLQVRLATAKHGHRRARRPWRPSTSIFGSRRTPATRAARRAASSCTASSGGPRATGTASSTRAHARAPRPARAGLGHKAAARALQAEPRGDLRQSLLHETDRFRFKRATGTAAST